MQAKGRFILLLIIVLLNSCALIKKRETFKGDSVYTDKSKVVTERYLDTIIVLKSDSLSYTFKQPIKDTVFTLTSKNGDMVRVDYKNGNYKLLSITAKKVVPIRILERVTEYKNITKRVKWKSTIAKPIFNLDYLSTLLIVIIVAGIFVYKRSIKRYV